MLVKPHRAAGSSFLGISGLCCTPDKALGVLNAVLDVPSCNHACSLLSSALSGIEQPGSSETEEAKRRRASGSVSGTSSLGAALEASLERLLAAEVEQAAATEIASSALAAAGPSGQLGPASSLAAGVLMSGDREKAHLMLPSSPTAAAAKAKAAPVLLLMDDDELADEKVRLGLHMS